MSRIYISYDHRDAAFARRLSESLEKRGLKVWRDPMNLSAGPVWEGEVERAIRQSDVYIALWSRNSVESDWVEREAFFGHLLGRLICARIDNDLDLDELPRFCRGYALQDIHGRGLRGQPDPFDRLTETIRTLATRKVVLEDRPLASEPQALANSRRAIDLLPGLLRDRDRSIPREARYAQSLRELSRSSFGHARFGVERLITTNPGDSGEGCLAALQAAIEESNDPGLWGLYGDVLAPFEPMAALTAYRRAGLPADYIDKLIPDRDRRETFSETPSGRRKAGTRAALATAAALLVLIGAGAVGIAQLGSQTANNAIQVSSAVVTPRGLDTPVDSFPLDAAQPATAPAPEWGEVQPQGGPSGADMRANGRTGDLPVLPPSPDPPAPQPPTQVAAATPPPAPPPMPPVAPAPLPVATSTPGLLPPVSLTPAGVIRLCRAGPLEPGERIEVVQEDESIGKFALRVSQGGAARIYERNKACLDDPSRQISRADGSVISGRDLVFPRDVLIIPADMPPPIWMLIRPPGEAGAAAPT